MKSRSASKSLGVISAAAMYGRFTTTIGVVFAMFFAVAWVLFGIASIVGGSADIGIVMIVIGLFIGALGVVYYKAVMKSRKVAAVVGAWNFFGPAARGRAAFPGGGGYPGGYPGGGGLNLVPPFF